jgi:class 3 adenylate cyclase/streptogramin lyase
MATRRGRALTTVVFTDIVDSSTIGQALGDARWRVLLGRHNETVRRNLKRYGGRELDTAGDGFFAAFDDPVAAVRCAAAIVEAVQGLGLDVRIGLHFGRIEQIGRKPGGVVVHIGARVMALAGPAQVLLTGTLRDLIPGGGFRFEDRGRHALKGISEESSIYRLTAVERPLPDPLTPEDAVARRDRIQAPAFLRRRRAPLLVGTTALVITVVLLALLLPGSSPSVPPRRSRIPAHVLLRLDPDTLRVEARIPLGHPLNTGFPVPAGKTATTERSIAIGPEGSVWVANGDDKSLIRVDPATNATSVIAVPAAPRAIAVGTGAVWIAADGTSTVYRIDPASRRVSASVHLRDLAYDVAVDPSTGAVWALSSVDLERIDPTSDTVVEVVPLPGFSPQTFNLNFFPFVNHRMAARGGSLWVPIPNGNLVSIRAEQRRTNVRHVAERLAEAVFDGDGSLWLTAGKQGILIGETLRVDPSSAKITDTLSGVGCCPGSVAFGEGAVWVTDERNGTVTRISVTGGEVGAPVRVGERPTSVAAGAGAVWVTLDPPD